MEYINGYKTEESLYTKDGKEISVLRLEVENEEKVLDEWATHFREQYCTSGFLKTVETVSSFV